MIDVRCPSCKNYRSCEQIGMIPFENCGMFVIDNTIKRHKTNADRIRSVTDEELAIEMTAKGGCPHDCEEPENIDTDCVKCWLDWLRREVSDG